MKVFISMPYGADNVYIKKRKLVEKLSKPLDISVTFGSLPPYTSKSEKETIRLIKGADYVMADLTYERPSCYFEVGYAYALRKPLDLIAMEGTDIHYVVIRDTVRFYKDLYEYKWLVGSLLNKRKKEIG